MKNFNRGYGNESSQIGGGIIQTNNKEFAYPIIHFYKIKESITLVDLKNRFGFSTTQSFAYLKKLEEIQNHLINETILEKIY